MTCKRRKKSQKKRHRWWWWCQIMFRHWHSTNSIFKSLWTCW